MAKTNFIGIKDWEKVKSAQALGFIIETENYLKEKDNFTLDGVFIDVLSNSVEVIKRDTAELNIYCKNLEKKKERLEKALYSIVEKLTKKDYIDILKIIMD
jgi:hypothetical protein